MVNKTEVEAQLQRILASPAFVGSPRAKQFLRYCVHHGSSSHNGSLKETTLAIEIFNRPPDYNPKSDPIVRVHARRVRHKLDTYYRTDGLDDPIRIDLPKGGYVPLISHALPTQDTQWIEPEFEAQHPAEVITDKGLAGVAVPPGSHGIAWPAWLLFVLPIGLILLWAYGRLSRASPDPAPSSSYGLLQPLGLPDHASDPAWSPDGARLAFTATDSSTGIAHVYIHRPASGAPPLRVTHDDHAEVKPVWSPDGRSIAFLKSLDLSRFEIECVRLDDGKIQSFGSFNSMAYVTQEHAALDWSPDGKSLLSTQQMSPSSPMRLVLISLATGERTALTSPPTGSTGDIDGKFSPDGKWIAFRRGGLGDLFLVSIRGEDSSPARQITYDMPGVRGIAWCDGGRAILFGTNRGSTNHFGIWKVPITGGTPEQVSPTDFDAIDPSLSRNATIAFAHRELVTALTLHPLNSGISEETMFPSNAVDMAPALSPDGKLVAFASTRSGWEQLWIGRTGDATPIQVTHFANHAHIFFSSWSPDSRLVAFSSREGAATNIFIYFVASGAVTPVTKTRNRDIAPAFSADGKYLYYSSNDDGTSRIWRVRTDGSRHPEPMFWEAVGGYLPSSDGKWMYFLEGGQSVSLIRRNLKDGTSESVFNTAGSPAFFKAIAVANGSVYVAVSTTDTSQADVFQIAPEHKTAKLVTHLTGLPPQDISGFTVSSDGKLLIVSRIIQNVSNLYSETMKQSP